MVRWPGKVPARKSNEMVAIHDFLPTFAAMLGGDLPADRPTDGRNQLDFFTGQTEQSAREDYLAFLDGEVSAVRWRHWRIYPKQIMSSAGNPRRWGFTAIGLRAWVTRPSITLRGTRESK